ncbi:MAG TPA: lytic transglycosylase domain-containing protein [Vicinamibacterales bacterium]|nr:lytic transglycosylase domain-containing protein [Vicinamibacterales bacterium]
MRVPGTVPLVLLTSLAVLTTVAPASAEIVFLASGRTLSVKQHRDVGDSVILTLRDGGEVTCNKTVIDRIVPDEVPHPDPVAAQAPQAAQSPSDAASLLQSKPYGEIIMSVAQAHGVDPLLVSALIQVESGYKPRARSHKGAMGLMQIMPATAREYNVRNPFDPKANIEAGITHLKSLIDRWGVKLGLAAYNAGEGAVEKFNGIPPYRETRTYVSRILSLAGLK